jgi:TetR/AcrR family tetracycline transcriptional repressor
VDADIITGAALGVLDEVGLDKLSMRLVAARLGVQAGGLYYYVADKAAMLRRLADELCDQALAEFAAGLAGVAGAADRADGAAEEADQAGGAVNGTAAGTGYADWEDEALALCGCVRAVLNRHRDSARVLAASPLSGSLNALTLMERLIAALEPGIAADRVNLAADTLMAYVTGFVLQEQSGIPDRFPLTLDDLAARFPRIFRTVGGDDDRDFTAAVTAIIDGFRPPR